MKKVLTKIAFKSFTYLIGTYLPIYYLNGATELRATKAYTMEFKTL